ncbi:MAG: ArsA family ATPase [Cyanobacteria bacterium P01_F01_bin.42]
MAFILTFLGKGGTGRTTIAIAAAHALASQGKRVLLASRDLGPGLVESLGIDVLGLEPTSIAENLEVVQVQAATLLSQSWGEVKAMEAQYLRTPFLKSVFAEELGLLPGMADALTLYWLRAMDGSDRYDAIVFDGADSQDTLRMFGIPEVGSWYARRFKKVFDNSDFAKTVMPLLQPIAATVLSGGDFFGNNFSRPMGEMDGILEAGQKAIADPGRVAAFLVTTPDSVAQKVAQQLWGGAQQVNLTVGGVLVTPSAAAGAIDGFDPLSTHSLPQISGGFEAIMPHLPNFAAEAQAAPRPVTVDVAQRQVKLFLPGFAKGQVKLIQSGPELTIEAGDQRRNLMLPDALKGEKVKGAKFQDSSLVINL